ncbi:MAG: ABC transporter ATP-binding protein [Bacilli bacterium]|nr:ABC transporter ATP-binding protein [Bacilli bacterium]MBN2876787.1 ABC transporter ATP-binding protein [Bacilli bacterium]
MEPKDLNQQPNKHIFKMLMTTFKWMGRYWPFLILSFGFLYFVSYARTLLPLFGQHIIDVILTNPSGASRLPSFLANLLVADTKGKELLLAAGVIVALAVFRALFIFFRRWTSGYFGETVAYKLRNKLYRKLQNANYFFHTHSETGDLIQRCTSDVQTYKNFIAERIIEVFRLVLLVGLSIYQMSKLNTNLTWISLMIAPVLLGIAVYYFRKVEQMFTVIENNEAKMTTHVQENVSAARVVKAFANEPYEVKKFDNLNRTFTDSDFNLIKKMSVFWSVTDFISFMQFCLIAVFGIIYASRGIITLGVYTAFLAYAGNIIWPMRQLGRLVGDFSKSTVAVYRLTKIIENEGEYDMKEPNETPEIKGNVKFDHVSFKFVDSTEDQIVDINFEVKKGQTVAIIGKTGSGKSTLMNLLVRLLDYQKGEITIDGIPIRNIEKHYLRDKVGYILQEPFLFSKSVEENIAIADKNIDNDRVESVAKIAAVHDDIINFENGYKTLVGERGVTLSGGQKQRVAIARMLLKPKPILIFDDSLSAVDTETDIQIRKALDKEWKSSTVFIITHRITTAKEADMIIVVEDGKVKETGTHDELVKREGMYKNIWEIQSRIDFQIEGGESNE